MATVSNNHTETYSLDIAAATKTNRLREPSFSSYLSDSEQNFVRKLAASASTHPNGLSFSFNPRENEEIEVFAAEKYFNGAIMDPVVAVEQTTATLRAGTCSISSTNSQSPFLGRTVHRHHRKKSDRVRRRSFLFAALGCKYCSCSDSGSVDVLDNDDVAPATSSTKTTTPTTTEISSSSWETLNSVSSNPWIREEMMMQRQKYEAFRQGFTLVEAQTSPKQEKNPRESLEVFESSPSYGNMESFLTMGQKTTKPITLSGEMRTTDSDTSSDLFEIESVTGKVDSYLTRQTSDATSSDLYPTATREAPSEASIEWSIVTAGAADFSLMSDFEEVNKLSSRTNDLKLRRQQEVMDPKKIGKNGGDVHRRLSTGSFLGCKSQKAVEVAGDAFRSVSRRFRGEERQVDSRQVNRGLSDLGFSDAAARF